MDAEYLIAALLATQTGLIALISKLLFSWMTRQEQSVGRCHERVDGHIGDHAIHTVSVNK